MASQVLGVRVMVELLDCNGDPDHIEVTAAIEPMPDEPDRLEIRQDGDEPMASVPLPVVWEVLRLLGGLPVGSQYQAEGVRDAD